ncbi:group 1 glycosyl transferase [Pedobacter sp. Leaf216]|uniref:glycosyltransferase family 4 protein n=1 Tax=Pedobacter sp. Leaf216 TaxID=1735684 RepID=UPI0006F74FD2|nr:glycosyltransferase family 4 protein [Pedobacter sp. Leaf216]KQM69550.1 group 1 glycosyl transferase [Pedobacter sp. Leaf216]
MDTKLCFVINSLEGGGAERVISNIANKFYSKGYTVTMICLNTAEVKYKMDSGVKIVNLVNRKNGQNFYNRLKYAWLTFYRLISILKREKPACTICFMTSANLWAGLCCLILRLPYLVSERITPDYTINKYNKLLQWISFKVYSKSKAIVLPAGEMGKGFKRNKLFKTLKNFKTIHNPVNNFKQATAAMVNQKRFILAVGRLNHQKGFDLLIDAYSRLQHTDVDLLISGVGPEEASLAQQIVALKLEDRVKLIGFKSNLQDYYTQAEVFVLSSRNEGYPNVLVEAMGMGCACVAMDCEFGPSEIINNGINGLLVDKEDVAALSEAIAKILNNNLLRKNISEKAKLINETNSIERISANWEQLIMS